MDLKVTWETSVKAKLKKQVAAGMLAFALWAPTVHAQNAPKMKMTTPVPQGITTADSVETRLGTLKFTDGFPDDATIKKVLDNLDFQRGVQSVLAAIPAASLHARHAIWETFSRAPTKPLPRLSSRCRLD